MDALDMTGGSFASSASADFAACQAADDGVEDRDNALLVLLVPRCACDVLTCRSLH